MKIISSGVVTNEYNDVLVMQRKGSQNWCAPGGSPEKGELLTDGLAREVLAQTGMYTMPIRLVSADFGQDGLHFTFRCLIRGGDPTPSDESPQVGFHKFQALPQPMGELDEVRLQQARNHVGPAQWQMKKGSGAFGAVRLLQGVWRRFGNEQPASAPVAWQVEVMTAVCDTVGALVCRDRGLPQAICPDHEPPWDTAAKLVQGYKFSQIAGIYIEPNSTRMILVFADQVAYRAEIPAGLDSQHQAILQDMRLDPDVTRVEYLPAVS